MNNRNILVDYLKGATMFLVVWGHSIQYSTTTYGFLSDPIFVIIYSFHMPLFMAVSGYLFLLSAGRRSFNELVKAKVEQILVPLLLWSILMLVVKNRSAIIHLPQQWDPLLVLEKYIEAVIAGIWFLWASFICSLLAILINKKLGDSLWAYAGITLLVFVMPNGCFFYYVKFMLPFFFGGYLYHKYESHLLAATRIGIYLSFLAFPLLVLFWVQEAYIYFSGPNFSLFHRHDLTILTYRYIIGFAGIIVFITAIKHLLFFPSIRVIEWLGKYSLGVYVLNVIFVPEFLPRLNLGHDNWPLYTMVLTPIISVGIAALCGITTQLISRFPLLNRYLLGGR